MKILINTVIIIFLNFLIVSAQGVSGVTANILDDDIQLSFNLGSIYQPTITTIWTDSDGNQGTCTGLCSLSSVFSDIEPGRYCVQVVMDDYFLPPGDFEGDCTHEIFSVTECFDLEGTCVCEDENDRNCGTTGEMSSSNITCLSSKTGSVSWDGELSPCLRSQGGQNNAKLEWSHGPTNASPLTPLSTVTSFDNLPPGKYCVKITPFNSNGDECDCVSYFCTEIGSLEEEPPTIVASINPITVCASGPTAGKVITPGSINVSATGGSGGGYRFRWIGNDPSSLPAIGDFLRSETRLCVEVTDGCNNVITKCFTIPIRRVFCGPIEIPTGGDGEGVVSETEVEQRSRGIINNESIRVYPVPAIDQLNIEFTSSVSSSSKMEILSIDGRRVALFDVARIIGNNIVAIPLTDLENGVYYLRLEGFQTTKFIVLQ